MVGIVDGIVVGIVTDGVRVVDRDIAGAVVSTTGVEDGTETAVAIAGVGPEGTVDVVADTAVGKVVAGTGIIVVGAVSTGVMYMWSAFS